jgi:hypothetical protein
MRIDDHPWNCEGIAKDDVGRLAPDPRQFNQFTQGLRHDTLMPRHNGLGATNQIGGLVAKKSSRADQCFDLWEGGASQGSRIREPGKERGGYQIDSHVGALGGEDGGHQQLPWGGVMQGTLSIGISPLQESQGLQSMLSADRQSCW